MERIENFIQLISFFEKYKSKRYLIFRGQADKDWPLLPKSGRDEYSKKYSPSFSEKGVFEAWVRYAKSLITKNPDNLWDWLAIAQHYGLATRLLDWTKNPLVAAYFACSEAFDKNGIIYILAVNTVNEPTIKDPFDFKGFMIYFPSGLASRIISQRGVFTISGKPEMPLDESKEFEIEKVEILSSAKVKILNSLELYNINAFSLFQDLKSLSDFLNDFVKNPMSSTSLADVGLGAFSKSKK